MNFLFAWRYFKAKKSTNAINVISWISIVAITIGTAALILVLSVFNGFEGLVKSLYSSFYPDIRIGPAAGKVLTLTPEQVQRLRAVPGVLHLSLVAEEKALLQNGDYQSMIYLKGVDKEYTQVTGIAGHVIKGSFQTGTAEDPLLVLGGVVENAVGVQSDRNLAPLVVYLPRKTEINVSNPLDAVSSDTINTAGAFLIQQEFDSKYALTNLDFIKTMMQLGPEQYGAVEISLVPGADEEKVQRAVQAQVGGAYRVETRYQQNQSLYSVMRVEKWAIYAILSLILVVAAFNMIGALTMLVLEKKQDINVLHALGASQRLIRRIFLTEGLLLGIIGGGTGMLLALLLALMQVNLKLIPLEGSSFLIDYFPVQLSIYDFLLVGATVLLIALLASWVPAARAARQQGVLREE
ncbi:FtsX-like permease family protein [Paracnuella aquatica]|uniref:FtsX-like permease family protein n=1 Tax=Paracnuella aquatica TaxID=2268757 RepID=UPI000DEFE02F|nr:FtsX-like permease family protein [Paracnuella aquatica]RPD47458.1 ABC transporter permease [Paracnuella aquatica]